MGYSNPPQQITTDGTNRQGIFLSDQTFVYVHSSERFPDESQLFFFDLEKNKAKPITFQRGLIQNGFVSDQKLYYSSNTDELKESPEALRKFLQRLPSSVRNEALFHIPFGPQELYRSLIDGTSIERLTENKGFDGFPALLPDGNTLVFSRWTNGQLRLMTQKIGQPKVLRMAATTVGHDLGVSLAPNLKSLAWSRISPDFKSSQIVVSDAKFKNLRYATLEKGMNWSPAWHPNSKSILFSSRGSSQTDYDIYEVSLEKDCVRRITNLSGDEYYPSLSPNGKKILFTATHKGSAQLFSQKYPEPFRCD